MTTPASALPIEPMHSIEDIAHLLKTTRRQVERLRTAGTLPAPDMLVGRMPRWKSETIRTWIDGQAKRG